MIKIHILPCGSTIVDEALPFCNKSRNPLAFTGLFCGKKHKISVPVTAYLIEHPKGLVLVDTGWDTAIRENAREYEGFFNYFASPGFLPEGEGIVDQLAALGYKTSNLDYCLLTHMDIDHAGGIGHVRDARHIMCSEAEWTAANKRNPRYLKRLWKGMEIETLPNHDFDLFGDGTVVAFPLHGHSAGLTGVRVSSGTAYVILAGDGGYGRPSWEEQILPGVVWNRKEAKKSLEKLRRFGNDTNCKAILMTHDPEHTSGIIEL